MTEEPTEDDFEQTIDHRWQEGSGEMHALKARVTVTDRETGESGTFLLRNTVDIGFQIFPDDDVDDGFAERAKPFIRENAPIYIGHRQTPSEGAW